MDDNIQVRDQLKEKLLQQKQLIDSENLLPNNICLGCIKQFQVNCLYQFGQCHHMFCLDCLIYNTNSCLNYQQQIKCPIDICRTFLNFKSISYKILPKKIKKAIKTIKKKGFKKNNPQENRKSWRVSIPDSNRSKKREQPSQIIENIIKLPQNLQLQKKGQIKNQQQENSINNLKEQEKNQIKRQQIFDLKQGQYFQPREYIREPLLRPHYEIQYVRPIMPDRQVEQLHQLSAIRIITYPLILIIGLIISLLIFILMLIVSIIFICLAIIGHIGSIATIVLIIVQCINEEWQKLYLLIPSLAGCVILIIAFHITRKTFLAMLQDLHQFNKIIFFWTIKYRCYRN